MKHSIWSRFPLACWIVWLAAGVVWADRPGDRSAGKHRFGFLDRSGYESRQSAQAFGEIELSDRVVYARQRIVAGAGVEAIVQGDHVAYHFDRQSGRLADFRVQWRDDIPDILPETIDKAGAEAAALDRAEEERIVRRLPGTKRNLAKVRFSGLYYLQPDSAVVVQHPAPQNPCWIVETEQYGTISAVVIDAVEGRIVGAAVPPPASGFSLTGPVNSDCTGGWYSWYGNARDWFNTMGYPTEAVLYPDQAKMIEEIQSMRNTLFYELAHGGSTSFGNGCSDGTSASEVTAWLTGIPAMPFAFLGSCDGMCSTGSGTLSYAFRKGLTTNTATVGYCGMGTTGAPCITSCWYSGDTIPWQTRLFEMLSQGRTIKEAFDTANADYPGCGTNACMRFAGDPSLRLVAPITRSGMPGRIYVDVNAVGANDGTGWDDAFVSLSDAIDAAYRGIDIWVAQGEYRPKADGLGRNAAFQLKDDIYIYGGFFPGATTLTQRDPTKYPTVLSGDLEGNDTVDPETRNDNSYHVIVAASMKDVLLDGLVITGGNADGADYEQRYGGGIYCANSRAVIRNCTITDNRCADRGGGIFVWDDSQPTLDRCRVANNASGVIGGGMASYGATNVQECAFEANTAQIGGGLWGRIETLTGCRFTGNVATQNGGGVYAIANMTIENGLFSENQAATFGGAIYGQDCNLVIRNCTLANNQANQFGGSRNDGGTTLALNSILWNNSDNTNDLYGAQIHGWRKPVVEYSCVTGWTMAEGGLGNLAIDPLFADADSGDFHLQSAAGRWNSSTGKWVYDKQTSRCIDAGSPSMALGLETKGSANLRIDMGCYGGSAEASRTPAGWSLLADMNNDGAVEMEDFAILSESWGMSNIWPLHPDLTRNGTVDLEDLELLIESWMDQTTWHP